MTEIEDAVLLALNMEEGTRQRKNVSDAPEVPVVSKALRSAIFSLCMCPLDKVINSGFNCHL